METFNTFKVGSATVRIVQDDDAGASPLDDDSAIIMAVLHRRYVNPAKKLGLDDQEAIEAFAKENERTHAAFPLFLYDHSGTAYRVSRNNSNPFIGNAQHAAWDSGRVGTLFVRLDEIGDSDPFKVAESFCKVYTDWANGNVWGFIIDTPDEENVDSCWGFIGNPDDSYIVAEATEAAKHAAKKYDEAHARELEAERPDMYATAEGGAL